MTLEFKDEFFSQSPEETLTLGHKIARSLSPGCVVCLHGHLGAGKSLLTKGIIQALTQLDPLSIISPTFQYLHIYQAMFDVCHFDCYRLNSLEEFQELGFEDYIYNKTTLSIIEWPEKITSALPKTAHHIYIHYLKETKRHIQLTFRLAS